MMRHRSRQANQCWRAFRATFRVELGLVEDIIADTTTHIYSVLCAFFFYRDHLVIHSFGLREAVHSFFKPP